MGSESDCNRTTAGRRAASDVAHMIAVRVQQVTHSRAATLFMLVTTTWRSLQRHDHMSTVNTSS